jgi:hypothetical protein
MNSVFEALAAAKDFIEAVKSFYGQGLGLANWHRNGDLLPFDAVIDENSTGEEAEGLDRAAEALRAVLPTPEEAACLLQALDSHWFMHHDHTQVAVYTSARDKLKRIETHG